MSVALVTDSTAALPMELVRRWGIDVVPLRVTVGNRDGREGIDVFPEEVAEALRAHVPVTTSLPPPGDFLAAYAHAAERGATAVVSLHLSGALSGTVGSARAGAASAAIPVHVVDSRSVVMGLGFPVLAAAAAAAAGAAVTDVVAAARTAMQRTRALFYVDTLEHLRRGGRIGATARAFGTALAVKPLLEISDGSVALLEKVRTAGRALARLEELAVRTADVGDAAGPAVDLAVHHLAARDRAEGLATRLRDRVPYLGELHLSEVGSVVGAHVGPGLLGVVIHRRG